jgi:hypothetical protein
MVESGCGVLEIEAQEAENPMPALQILETRILCVGHIYPCSAKCRDCKPDFDQTHHPNNYDCDTFHRIEAIVPEEPSRFKLLRPSLEGTPVHAYEDTVNYCCKGHILPKMQRCYGCLRDLDLTHTPNNTTCEGFELTREETLHAIPPGIHCFSVAELHAKYGNARKYGRERKSA